MTRNTEQQTHYLKAQTELIGLNISERLIDSPDEWVESGEAAYFEAYVLQVRQRLLRSKAFRSGIINIQE